jgi:hypothetical protein
VDFADGKLSAAQIMGIADRMCYAAKAGGRDRVATYHRKAPGESTAARRGAHTQASTSAVRSG